MFDPKKLFDMMKNAGEMQKNMAEKLKQFKATGEAAGGMVKVDMNGHFEVEALTLDDSLMKEDKTFVAELVKAAVNDATAQLRANLGDQFKSIFGNLGF